MMSRTFGAPFGGTTRGAHQGVDSVALSLITPPNFGGNGGSCFPSSEVVALGEPGIFSTGVAGPALFDFAISPPAPSVRILIELHLRCTISSGNRKANL